MREPTGAGPLPGAGGNSLSDTSAGVSDAVQNNRGEDIDWGSLDIYTCAQSCCGGSGFDKAPSEQLSTAAAIGEGYLREYVILQPPPPLRYV